MGGGEAIEGLLAWVVLCTDTHTHTHTHIHTHTFTVSLSITHKPTHTYTHAHTHKHACMHAFTCSPPHTHAAYATVITVADQREAEDGRQWLFLLLFLLFFWQTYRRTPHPLGGIQDPTRSGDPQLHQSIYYVAILTDAFIQKTTSSKLFGSREYEQIGAVFFVLFKDDWL